MPPSREQKRSQTKTRKQEVKKHEYHTIKTMALKDNLFSEKVGAHAWIDSAPVTVLSTVRELGSEVAKTRKRPGIKSTNAKRAREAFGDAEEKEMPIPLCIDDYNQHIGGVNIADQLRGYRINSDASSAPYWVSASPASALTYIWLALHWHSKVTS